MNASLARRHQAGLTLIELMVALAVFAVLGVLSFRALSAASTSQTRLDASFLRWSALDRSLGRVDSEFMEITVPSSASPVVTTPALQFVGSSDGVSGELSFLRLDAERGVRRAGFRLRDEKLEWLLWEGREAVGAPQVEVLLDHVRALRWQFIDAGQRRDDWAPDAAHIGRLPDGVVVEIELPELGTFQRIFALR